jgi:hypothetical protein
LLSTDEAMVLHLMADAPESESIYYQLAQRRHPEHDAGQRSGLFGEEMKQLGFCGTDARHRHVAHPHPHNAQKPRP